MKIIIKYPNWFPTRLLAALALVVALSALPLVHAQRQMENLGRGVVAIHQPDGKVFVSWRLLGTDPENIAFNLYRKSEGGRSGRGSGRGGGAAPGEPVKLNREPLTGPTCFVDTTADLSGKTSYFVRPVLNGVEQAPSAAFPLAAGALPLPYLSIPLRTPPGYTPNDASVGDLDGDGEYEIVLHQAGRSRDNAQTGLTDPPILQAYQLDGTFLWEINLGKNIREGAHYTQFMVYDLDGDGRAEIVCKTADGTIDGTGKVIGDAQADYVAKEGSAAGFRAGYVMSGPEFLTVFDGRTGAALATVPYNPPRHPTQLNPTGPEINAIWGDGKGQKISDRKPRSCNFAVWWDGDLLREILDSNRVTKWNWLEGTETPLLTAQDCLANNGSKSTPALSADLFGDWREEVVWRTADGNELRVYTTTMPTTHRLTTLMHDPQYRLAIAWQNVAYNQPPHPSFYLGEGMAPPPRPNIVTPPPSREMAACARPSPSGNYNGDNGDTAH